MIVFVFIGLLVSLLSGVCIIRWARAHTRNYDADMPQRFHLGDVPRLGGLAIYAGLLAGWGSACVAFYAGNKGWFNVDVEFAARWAVVLLPALVGGVVEDLTQRMRVVWRLVLTGTSAVLALWLFDVALGRAGFALLDEWMALWPWLGVAVAALAIAGLPHAFNIIDGYNGLAGMVALVVLGALAYVALQVQDRQLMAILLCAAGATAGFLFWNYPRGLLFAGDGGAYLWGVVIALASLLLVTRHPQVSPWFPVLLLIYPIWETLFSIYRKLARGISPSVADALHFHQLIYRRIVRNVFDDDATRSMLMRNNRTSPYLWSFTVLTVAPAVIFWRTSWVLIFFCVLFVLTYVLAYLAIVRFKVPPWMQY